MVDQVMLTLQRKRKRRRIEATRVHFSAHQCFQFDGSPDETACLRAIAGHLKMQPGLALYGQGPLFDTLLDHAPDLGENVRAVLADGAAHDAGTVRELPVRSSDGTLDGIRTVFLCETRAFPRMQMRKRLPAGIRVLDADILIELASASIPARSWTPIVKHIYPIDVPEIRFRPNLDLLVIDCPARNLALMPNGLGYVNNALKKTAVAFQVFDLDIVTYHRYHIRRLLDEGGEIVLPNGREMPTDPWQAEHYDVWTDPEVIRYLMPIIDEAAAAIVEARPRMLGLSVQQCSEAFSRELVNRVKAALPEIRIVVGGFSCYNPDIGLRAFPEADYMCIGEADLTIGPLVEALAHGERPRNQAGVLSRYDTPDHQYLPAPMPHNLDHLDFPRYEWFDIGIYRNYNGYQLVPVIASRGCRWSRCTFCAERFYWRIRSAKNFVDELEWLVGQGCTLFMFNESDLNGMPEKVLEICDEIIRRDLKVRLTGQLRIHKKSDRAYFQKLREAGFVALRFGVDAFSENTLRLQRKGYTTEMVSQNLRDCWEAGIYTEVNWVIGVPGETEADCEEGIQLILQNRRYIGRLANINPLILVNGGVYWIDPEAHNIKFRGEKTELYAKYPRAIPADLWYSTEPYIDAQVRKERFERIVLALHDAGFPVGAWAERIIEDVRLARDSNRAGAKAAEPNTAALAAAPAVEQRPKLIRSLATHNIVFYKDRYYALPHALGEIDIATVDPVTLPGVIEDTAEAALLVAVEHASKWADLRGHYDARAAQRAAGSYFRAGSNLLGDDGGPEFTAERPEILRFGGEYFAVEREALAGAFAAPAMWSNAEQEEAEAAQASVQISGTPLRRLANLLPAPLVQECRRLWRARQFRAVQERQGRPSDLVIAGVVAGGLASEYVVQPVKRLFGPEAGPHNPEATPVPGQDFSIIASVTKGATPELLSAINHYNIVQFDGAFYLVPHGTSIDWPSGEAAGLPGVRVAATAKEIMAQVMSARSPTGETAGTEGAAKGGSGPAEQISTTPVLLGTVGGYNIVTYEGWVYGVPQSLGEINLAETDVIEIPGVVRDVSRDVVENEILERVNPARSAAAE